MTGAVVVGTGFGCLIHVRALRQAGFELAPAVRMHETVRTLIEGGDVPEDRPPPTFADGVATMDVLDSVRRSDGEGGWADIAPGGSDGA